MVIYFYIYSKYNDTYIIIILGYRILARFDLKIIVKR